MKCGREAKISGDEGELMRPRVLEVCGVCICGDASIATPSRDWTVRFWSLDPSEERKYWSSRILFGHSSFVGPLAWIPPNEEYPEGGIGSGGMEILVSFGTIASQWQCIG
ncbi:hypothetical protein GH714_041909 [Hevea brasiliensis]|uniref:Uncharacterized protein n=1 Tax=Hevea brasiliensis TaxID=3981 RepID=A0A6A6MVZ8_HEVBR|nr:hypothetical protein GH714_041909 [Hevea brasiliensis]